MTRLFSIISSPLVLILLLSCYQGCEAGKVHKSLMKDLFANYDSQERPVENESDRLDVTIGVTLLSIMEMNVAHGYLETNLWMSETWIDFNLRWNSSKYGGIEHVNVGTMDKIWTPDISLYNGYHPDPRAAVSYLVFSSGSVIHVPPGIFKSICSIDIPYYPFDVHACELKFGTWTSHGDKVNLKLKEETGIDLSYLLPHSDWEVLSAPGAINTKYYPCCQEPYVDATYTINLQRRGHAIFWKCTFALFCGALAIVVSSFLTPNSGRRIILQVIVLLCLVNFNVTIHEPLGGQKTILASYFQTLYLMIFLSILINVGVIHFYTRNPNFYEIPNWAKTLFFERLPPHLRLVNFHNQESVSRRGQSASAITNDAQPPNPNFERIKTDLRNLFEKLRRNHTPTKLNESQYLAQVLDRLALVFFSAVISLFFIVYFFQLYIF